MLSKWATAICALLAVATPYSSAEDGGVNILVNELQRRSNESLLWGPYNPGLYFGLRPRIPKSLFTGLIWGRVDDYPTMQANIRWTCERGDDMLGYGWVEYDVRTGGKQVIHDQKNQFDIEVEFVKVPGGIHGGNWGARIRGTPREDAPRKPKIAIWFYAGVEEGHIKLENTPDPLGFEENIVLNGDAVGLGDFKLEITKGANFNRAPSEVDEKLAAVQPLERTIYQGFKAPVEAIWRVRNLLFYELKGRFEDFVKRFGEDKLPNPWQAFTIRNVFPEIETNLHMVQKVFEGKFEFDVLFSSASSPAPITSSKLTEKLEETLNNFRSKFNEVFRRQPPYDTQEYEVFAKDLFSNLLGGIGYFHGKHIVDRTEYPEDEENFWEEAKVNREKGLGKLEGPHTLFTSIPSRMFFPRGFLWDEGFHLLPIIEWDVDLALDIVKSWFSLVDDDGWIAREQILGDEARAKVPKEFRTQYPHYANPPTLILVLTRFIQKWKGWSETTKSYKHQDLETILSESSGGNINNLAYAILASPEASQKYLKDLYPLLRRFYYWFRDTQSGEVRAYDRTAFSSKEAYRWRGREPGYCLTSGIDDYPRAEPPHPGELHVDLISWMGFLSRLMTSVADAIGETDDAREYQTQERAILRNIDDLHWNEKHKVYCDATVDSYEESVHVCHVGYVSIFPFLLGLLDPKSEKLGHLLDVIGDEEQLWSPFGLRSLSRKDEFYSTGENYWRGPIWVNMNYLAILRLQEYGSVEGPYQKKAAKLYKDLRLNVVNNVYKVWKETGFAWEQYEQEKGSPKGVQHFLGWTSLVVNIMSLPETVSVSGLPVDREL